MDHFPSSFPALHFLVGNVLSIGDDIRDGSADTSKKSKFAYIVIIIATTNQEKMHLDAVGARAECSQGHAFGETGLPGLSVPFR